MRLRAGAPRRRTWRVVTPAAAPTRARRPSREVRPRVCAEPRRGGCPPGREAGNGACGPGWPGMETRFRGRNRQSRLDPGLRFSCFSRRNAVHLPVGAVRWESCVVLSTWRRGAEWLRLYFTQRKSATKREIDDVSGTSRWPQRIHCRFYKFLKGNKHITKLLKKLTSSTDSLKNKLPKPNKNI